MLDKRNLFTKGTYLKRHKSCSSAVYLAFLPLSYWVFVFQLSCQRVLGLHRLTCSPSVPDRSCWNTQQHVFSLTIYAHGWRKEDRTLYLTHSQKGHYTNFFKFRKVKKSMQQQRN